MTLLDKVEAVLTTAEKPMHYREIATQMITEGLWQTTGKTPWDTVSSQLSVDIQRQGTQSRFQRTSKGVFALRAWDLSYKNPTVMAHLPKTKSTKSKQSPEQVAGETGKAADLHQTLSFADAAERVLEQFGHKQPMHYGEITAVALKQGLITTTGITPAATMYATILTEIRRDTQRGQSSRFVKHGNGLVGLGSTGPPGLVEEIEHANQKVRAALLKRLKAMAPAEFEELIGRILVEIGFDEVKTTSYSNDGGIDVRGTMVLGGVIRITMAVQAKRWQNNVQAPMVSQVRGSLGVHERGMIITTSNFSSGARANAEQKGMSPIALMNGEELCALMVELGIGVKRETYDLLSLSDTPISPVPPAVALDGDSESDESRSDD